MNTSEARAKQRRGLIALNALLLGGLGVVSLAPFAGAQSAAQRSPGDYIVLGGEIQFANSSALYIIDSDNQEMVSVRWDDSRDRLLPIGYRDLAADSDAVPGR